MKHVFLLCGARRLPLTLRVLLGLLPVLLLTRPLLPRAAAQTIPLYTFRDTTGTYVPLGAGATPFSINAGGGTVDDGNSLPLPLPFAFPFAGTGRQSVIVNSNGWLTFAPTASQQVINNVLNQTQNLLVAFFGRDLDQRSATFRYRTDSVAPNRIFKIEGDSIAQYNPFGAPLSVGHVQVWLYESGRIELRYGAFNARFTTPPLTTTQVGLRGTGPADVRSLGGTWATPVVGTSPRAALPLDSANVPVNGAIFQFDPPTGLDLTPPLIGPVRLTPAACTPVAHTISVAPTDASGIASVRLTYSVGGSAPVTVALTDIGGQWSGTIPAVGLAVVTYSLTVTDAGPQANQATTVPATYADATLTVGAGPDQTINVGSAATLVATASPRFALKISEFALNSSGTGATQPRPAYLGTADDLVEITNIGGAPLNLSGYRFEVRGVGVSYARNFTFPNGTTLTDSAVLVLHLGRGVNSPANNFYHTDSLNSTVTDDPLGSGADVGFLLLAPDGFAVDGVAVNSFAGATGLPAGVWRGAGASSPFGIAGAGLHGPDLGTNANWTPASPTVRQTIGTFNPGLSAQPLPRVTWTGGVLAAPDTTNPLVTPLHPAAGAFTYTVVTTADGCTATDSVTVTVVSPAVPGAAFIASATRVGTADTVAFTDLSTNRPTAWLWTFAPATVTFVSGTSATSRHPRVRFTRGGCYTVTLAATNAAGTDPEIKTDYVCADLSYCVASLQDSACHPTSVHLNAVSIAGTTLSNLNSGCANTTGNAYTRYPASGSTTATLVAGRTYALTVQSSGTGSVGAWLDTNANGLFEATEFILVTAGAAPPAPATSTVMFTVPTTALRGAVVVLRLRNSRTAGSITAPQPCAPRANGETEDYLVTLAPACTLAAPTISSNSPVCSGSVLTLGTSPPLPAGTAYAWTGPNGFTSTAGAPSIPNATAAVAGTYSLVISRNGCSAPAATTTVALNSLPPAPAGFTLARCGPGSLRLAFLNVPPGTTYRWYPTATGGTAIAGANLSYTTPVLTATTTYYVSIVVGGCQSLTRAAVTAQIDPAATATLTAGGPTTFCGGGSVTLTAAGGAPGATYAFRRNNVLVAGASGSSFTATLAGSYTVTVTEPTTRCAATSAAVVVVVNPQASATFAYPSGSYCRTGPANPRPTITGTPGGTFTAAPAGLTINATTGQITSGASSPGAYAVTYTVAGTCPAALTQTMTITTAPTAGFTYFQSAPPPVCAGTMATLTPIFDPGASGGVFSAAPAGLSFSGSSGVVYLAASQPGAYTITNTIAASGTCPAATATTTLLVVASPTATIAASGPPTFCAGDSVTLTASAGATYVWSTGATTPSITVGTAGLYSVTATNAAGCAVTSAPVTVVVHPRPTAAFAYSAAAFCVGPDTTAAPTISGTAGGVFTAAPAGLTINATTGQINLTASSLGSYVVTYAFAGPCPASAIQAVSLSAAPRAAFSYATAAGCAGIPGTLALSLAPGATLGTLSVLPAAGLALSAGTGTVDLAASQAGTYSVRNVVSGCASDTATATITVHPQPTLQITNLSAIYCTADPAVSLTGTVDGVAGVGTFTVNGALATQLNPGALGVGTYQVGFTGSTAVGCPASTTQTVTVAPSPLPPTVTAVPQASGVVLLTSSAPTGNQWYLNGTLIVGATSPTYSVGSNAQSGFYSVVSTAGSCASAPSTLLNVAVTGTAAALAAAPDFHLFPNPTADGRVLVELIASATPGRPTLPLTVLDVLGRAVFRAEVPTAAGPHALDLRTLPAGVYWVRVLTAAGPAGRRLVRE